MSRRGGWSIVATATLAMIVAGCQQVSAEAAHEPAIQIEERDGGLDQLTLAAHAAERLGIATAPVEARGEQLVVPYAAVIYDAHGAAWVYVQGKALTFERAAITVEQIRGDDVIVTDGPPAGASVVTVGAAELYGAEIGVGGGH
jgi:multidrug efflux pump subunit AcrA (membrane-fusion protein)